MVTSSLPTNLFLLFVLSCQTVQKSSAQSSNSPGSENRFQYPSVDPATAIIIVVLIAALFTVAFFSIYIRNRAAANSNTIRQTFSMRRRTAAATRGLENSVIETFPTFTHAEVKDHHIGKGALECAVCLNEFEDDQMLRLIPKCDHVFHPECIDAWLKSHVTCPVCRADLTPQPDEPALSQDPEVNREGQEQAETENLQQNNEVSIQIEGDKSLMLQQEEVSVRPEVKRNLSFNASNRPPRSFSIKRTRMFSKFRSHSTGHSLVVPGENLDRYTLRLPENVRKEVMNRALLNRTKSCAVTLPRHGSSTRGYRTGNGEGSNRGARSFRRIERFDQEAKSDRWVFKIVPPFFSRGSSMRSLKVRADNEEGSTSRSVKMAVKMPSFKCLEGDEPGLLAKDYLQLKEFKSVQ